MSYKFIASLTLTTTLLLGANGYAYTSIDMAGDAPAAPTPAVAPAPAAPAVEGMSLLQKAKLAGKKNDDALKKEEEKKEEKKKEEEKKKTDCEKKAREELKLAGLPDKAIEAAMADKSKACVSIPPTNVAEIPDDARAKGFAEMHKAEVAANAPKKQIYDRIVGNEEVKGATAKGDSYYGDKATKPVEKQNIGAFQIPEKPKVEPQQTAFQGPADVAKPPIPILKPHLLPTEANKKWAKQVVEMMGYNPEKTKNFDEMVDNYMKTGIPPKEANPNPELDQKIKEAKFPPMPEKPKADEIEVTPPPVVDTNDKEAAKAAARATLSDVAKKVKNGWWPQGLDEKATALLATCTAEGQSAGWSDKKISNVCKTALETAYHESARSLSPKKPNGINSAYGLFQQIDTTFVAECMQTMKLSKDDCMDKRSDAYTQIKSSVLTMGKRYDQYVAGKLKCGNYGSSFVKCNYIVYHHTNATYASDVNARNGYNMLLGNRKYTNGVLGEFVAGNPELAAQTLADAGSGYMPNGDVIPDYVRPANGTPSFNLANGFDFPIFGGNSSGGNIFGGGTGGGGNIFGGSGGGGNPFAGLFGGMGGGSSGGGGTGGFNYGTTGGASAGEGLSQYAQYPIIIGPIETAELQPDEKLCIASQRGV